MAELHLKNLLHKPIENTVGERLGTVADVIIDSRQGRIDYVTIELMRRENDHGAREGWRRERGHSDAKATVMIDWSQFHVVPGKRALVLDFSISALTAAAHRQV